MGWRNNADPVIDGKLYIGNILTATTPQSLVERHITHIVSVCTEPIPADNPASGFITFRIPVEDTPTADLLRWFAPACQFIHAAMQDPRAVVLVHCGQGLARSACVIAAYFMWSQNLSATDSLAIVRRAREQIWPNPGQQEQLVLFELCRYKPSDAEGIYNKWRRQVVQRLAQLPLAHPGAAYAASPGAYSSGSGSGSSGNR